MICPIFRGQQHSTLLTCATCCLRLHVAGQCVILLKGLLRVGFRDGILEYIGKPKRMRWVTFARKLKQVKAAEVVCDAHLLHLVQKLAYGLPQM